MTHTRFYKLVLALWGEKWRTELRKLLEPHGLPCARQTFWNWQHKKTRVPEPVAELLEKERKRKSA